MRIILLSIVSLSLACGGKPEAEQTNLAFESLNYQQLQEIVNQDNNKLYVLNFWATWCMPCIEELPHFMEVNQEYKNKGLKMILVSLDKRDELQEGVKSMKEKLSLNTDIYLLDDIVNMNTWIPATDESWTGAIPATVLYKNGQKIAFIEGQLNKQELEQLIKKHL